VDDSDSDSAWAATERAKDAAADRHANAALLAMVRDDADTAAKEIDALRELDPDQAQIPALRDALARLKERLSGKEKPDAFKAAEEDIETAVAAGVPAAVDAAVEKASASNPADPRVEQLRKRAPGLKDAARERSRLGAATKSGARNREAARAAAAGPRNDSPKGDQPKGDGAKPKDPFRGTHIGG
jgi:hypothetical protein